MKRALLIERISKDGPPLPIEVDEWLALTVKRLGYDRVIPTPGTPTRPSGPHDRDWICVPGAVPITVRYEDGRLHICAQTRDARQLARELAKSLKARVID